MIRLKQTHTTAAFIFFVLVVMCLFFSCKKEEAAKIERNFNIKIYQNDVLWRIPNEHSKIDNDFMPIYTPNKITFTLDDTTDIRYVEWNLGNMKFFGHKKEFNDLPSGSYTISATVNYYNGDSLVNKKAKFGDKYFDYLYLRAKPEYFADSLYFDLFTTNILYEDTIANVTYKTILNHFQRVTGTIAKWYYYDFFAITLPVNEQIAIQQYYFTPNPKTQKGVWFLSFEDGGLGSVFRVNEILNNPNYKLNQSPSADNFFNVTDIIYEGGLKKIVGDFKYNDGFKGKFKLRI